ncbi:MAG: cytochrome c3 family protein [Gemmatimonadota bacterium]
MRIPSMGRYLSVLSLVLVAAACGTDTETIFVERELFDDPPVGAAGFLGFGTVEAEAAKLTVCGNCHVGKQGDWEGTAHADAFATLTANPGAQAFCEGCHTVGQLGNPTTADGGWTATGNPRYHDVQCESCHGPGETHVANPDASQPLAQLDVGADLTSGCGECHTGSHHPFVEEWEQSKHAQVVGFAASNEACAGCHRGQGALKAWGVLSDYVEKDSPDHLPITCGVCHDPHDATNEGQLRFPVQTASVEEHLCARCHDRRTAPDPNSSHGLGPHSPETALLQGTAGWFPPDATINEGQIRATHGSDLNTRLCATCHVAKFTVTDLETGDFVFNATGHRFEAIPCVDAQGVPVGGTCALDAVARSFGGCTEAGCHSEAGAVSALTVAGGRIRDRANDVLSQLMVVDPGLDAAGGEIDAADPRFSVAEGAFFNLNLAIFPDEGVAATLQNVAGSTVHNPFLTEALLIASIAAIEDEYAVSPSANVGVDWDAELQLLLKRLER